MKVLVDAASTGRQTPLLGVSPIDDPPGLRLTWKKFCGYNAAFAWIKQRLTDCTDISWRLWIPRLPDNDPVGVAPIADAEQQLESKPVLKRKSSSVAEGAPPKAKLNPQPLLNVAQPEPKQVPHVETLGALGDSPNRIHLVQKALRGIDAPRGELSCKYATGKILGEGTFGRVVRFKSEKWGDIAVKHLKTQDGMELLREVDLLTRIFHPGVVRLLDVDCSYNFSLLFPYVGDNLARMIRQHRSSKCLPGWRSMWIQLLDALAYLHSLMVVHSDFKPGNILVSSTKQLQICDFGRSFLDLEGCRRDLSAGAVSREDFQYGTLNYRAIEVFLGDRGFGRPMDVWAFALVAMEMLTLSMVVRSDKRAQAISEIFNLCGRGTEEDARDYLAGLPWWQYKFVQGLGGGTLKKILAKSLPESTHAEITKMLCLNPAKRPSASDAARVLRSVLGGSKGVSLSSS